jgi:hypothetical protein
MQKNLPHGAMVAGAVIGAAGLLLFGRIIWTAARAPDARDNPKISQDFLRIYAPAALINFAKTQHSIETNEELIRLIGQADLHECWFVVVTRSQMQDGQIIDVPVIFRPGQIANQFVLIRNYLHTLAGSTLDEHRADATVVVIPSNLITKEPLRALPELLEQ